MNHSIYVGLSGGVDSAVAAAMLKAQGCQVTGVFIKIWQPEFIECTWREDRLDAMRVCAALEIPFREIDLSEQYKKEVVDAMIADYARGVTPNPDVLCNRAIKFGAFAAWARKQGASAVATGHYARIKSEMSHVELMRATDGAKDQSYFLHTLTQQDLRFAIFPIGELPKALVRKEAQRLQLPVAQKPDSQGLCFIGEVTMRDFLARYLPLTPGRVVEKSGRVIGEHEGAPLYTLGQRHGFTVRKGGGPYFVVGIDIPSNTVRVSKKRDDAARGSVVLEHASWTHHGPESETDYLVQARYHEEPVRTRLARRGEQWLVTFAKPHIASPGQSVVVYRPTPQGDVCLGGGIVSLTRSSQVKVQALKLVPMSTVQ